MAKKKLKEPTTHVINITCDCCEKIDKHVKAEFKKQWVEVEFLKQQMIDTVNDKFRQNKPLLDSLYGWLVEKGLIRSFKD